VITYPNRLRVSAAELRFNYLGLLTIVETSNGHAYIETPYFETMASSRPPGLLPDEVAFLCGMELVTIIPRQRLEGLELIGVYSSHPAHTTAGVN
jgi:hypothetical protein